MCVVGWSPTGINYETSDGQPISIIVMYLVPSNQRNHYLREISILAKVLKSSPEVDRLSSIADLSGVRDFLLDLIAASKETVGPDARARMIRLQAKTALGTQPVSDLSGIVIEPLSIIAGPGIKPFALTQNLDLMNWVEMAAGLAEKLESDGSYQNGIWRIVRRHGVVYQGGRTLYDCLALTTNANILMRSNAGAVPAKGNQTQK